MSWGWRPNFDRPHNPKLARYGKQPKTKAYMCGHWPLASKVGYRYVERDEIRRFDWAPGRRLGDGGVVFLFW